MKLFVEIKHLNTKDINYGIKYNVRQIRTIKVRQTKTKCAKQNTKNAKKRIKYAEHNTKYAAQNTKYPQKMLIYAVFLQGDFCYEYTHFLAYFLQAQFSILVVLVSGRPVLNTKKMLDFLRVKYNQDLWKFV